MTSQQLKRLKQLLESQSLAVLTATRRARPESWVIPFAASWDLRTLLLALRGDAAASAVGEAHLVVDDRSTQGKPLHGVVSVAAVGNASLLDAHDERPMKQLFLARHPEMKELVLEDRCTLLRLEVETYRLTAAEGATVSWNPSGRQRLSAS